MVGIKTAEAREIPRDTDALAHYFEKADRALYYGKRTGRDKIVRYQAGLTDPENLPPEPVVQQTVRRTSKSVSETVDGKATNRKFGRKKTTNPVLERKKSIGPRRVVVKPKNGGNGTPRE